jgi:hypothetical protein
MRAVSSGRRAPMRWARGCRRKKNGRTEERKNGRKRRKRPRCGGSGAPERHAPARRNLFRSSVLPFRRGADDDCVTFSAAVQVETRVQAAAAVVVWVQLSRTAVDDHEVRLVGVRSRKVTGMVALSSNGPEPTVAVAMTVYPPAVHGSRSCESKPYAKSSLRWTVPVSRSTTIRYGSTLADFKSSRILAAVHPPRVDARAR